MKKRKPLKPPPRFDTEKRVSVRREVRLDGAIRFLDGQIAACEIRDISETGARLKLAVVEPIPPVFILEIPGNSRVRRRCELVRQDGARIGCRFQNS